MEELLTDEDKLYLRKVCNYMKSLGLSEGILEFDYDDYEYVPDESTIMNILSRSTHFSNNYRVEIPSKLIEIVEKIFKYLFDNDKFLSGNFENINYAKVELTIDCDSKEIGVIQTWYYYQAEDETISTWDSIDDDEEMDPIFNQLDELGYFSKDRNTLVLTYAGSGDSGYIENKFEDTKFEVPRDIENWCYDKLESQHGGWEINEGSQGRFVFYKNREIALEHAYNSEVAESETIFENSFGKKG